MENKEEPQPAVHHVDDMEKPPNGFAVHTETERTAGEKKLEKRLVMKIDMIIMPLLSIIYFLASMDRGDISNAAVAGLKKDLKLTPGEYANCVSLFYLGYIVFQLPGDIFLRKISPPIQLGLAMMTWGMFCALLATSRSYSYVVGLRVAIGSAEAFLQAAILYLSLWYKRQELTSRYSLMFSMQALAGSFNGVIAYGITKNLNGALGYPAWKWIFIVEGCITIAFGFVIISLLPPVPEKVRWGFSQVEKEMIVRRTQEGYNTLEAKIRPRQLLDMFKDVKIYLYIILYCCCNVSLAVLSGFLPVIISSLGYVSLKAQVLSIPVYVCAAASLLTFGFLSDKFKIRGVFLSTAFLITSVGWSILLAADPKSQKKLAFGGTFLVAIGIYPTVILTLGWMNTNLIGYTKRAGGLAALNMAGQCLSIAGSEVFNTPPRYIKGKAFALAFSLLGAIVSLVLIGYLARENKKKRENQWSDEAAKSRVLSLEEVCEKHPDFFYWL